MESSFHHNTFESEFYTKDIPPEITLFNSHNLKLFHDNTPFFLDNYESSSSFYSDILISQALKSHITSINSELCPPGDEDAFFVADLGEVYRNHVLWKTALPRIHPHYAVKCNPDIKLLKLLDALGCGFDCASKSEIDTILSLNITPQRIVFAQPVKTLSSLAYARSRQVSLMTFDNSDELYKIKKQFPRALLLLRIATDDHASLCRLSLKFGTPIHQVPSLLQLAKRLDLDVAGIAFHIGSDATDPNAFHRAVSDSRYVFDLAKSLNLRPRILDVGGGFSTLSFSVMSRALNAALEQNFPVAEFPTLQVIAEPGRYYAATAYTLAVHVIGRRVPFSECPDGMLLENESNDPVPSAHSSSTSGAHLSSDVVMKTCSNTNPNNSDLNVNSASNVSSGTSLSSLVNQDTIMIYVNDGVYGNFSCILFDHQTPLPKLLRCRGRFFYHGIRDDDIMLASPALPSANSSGYASEDGNSSTTLSSGSTPCSELTSPDRALYKYSIWGPTCDGLDCITQCWTSTENLQIGDWLYFTNMGAYTKCSATRFNGFTNDHHVIYVCSEPALEGILNNITSDD